MPSHRKGDVIQRQWEMLQLIPIHDHPGRSPRELADALETRGYRVTQRTIERDLENLKECLPLEINVRVRPRRWRWQKARGLDIPGMEAAEAMALFMTRDAMNTHLPSCFLDALHTRFSQADKTLAALARTGARIRWPDRVRIVPATVVLQPPKIAAKVIQTLQKSLLNDIPIEADYQSLQEAIPTKRLLYPRALILRGSSLYLIAHAKGSPGAPHHYAVQRFGSVRLRDLEAWSEASFSLDTFLADGTDQFGVGRNIRLRATITDELHNVLRDSPLSSDMEIRRRGATLTLSATVRDTWSLQTWLLGHAENIRILDPTSLRDLIGSRLTAAAAQYR